MQGEKYDIGKYGGSWPWTHRPPDGQKIHKPAPRCPSGRACPAGPRDPSPLCDTCASPIVHPMSQPAVAIRSQLPVLVLYLIMVFPSPHREFFTHPLKNTSRVSFTEVSGFAVETTLPPLIIIDFHFSKEMLGLSKPPAADSRDIERILAEQAFLLQI